MFCFVFVFLSVYNPRMASDKFRAKKLKIKNKASYLGAISNKKELNIVTW